MVLIFPILFVFLLIFKLYFLINKVLWKRYHKNVISIAFFHPYCNAGGGGERVLWNSIGAIQKLNPNIHCIVYTGDNVPHSNILKNVDLQFNIKLSKPIEIIHLRSRFFVEAKNYPFCTLLMQSIGSMFLGFEALMKHIPDVYIDTMGYAFTLPIFKFLGGSRVCAYVHFPTISTDMLNVVASRSVGVNNRKLFTDYKILSNFKLIYYKMFAYLYGLVGRRAEVIMVNSSWTRNHIVELWGKPEKTFRVYPPCDTTQFSRIPLEARDDKTRFLSIAQFRPEKNHELQIKAFHNFINRFKCVTPHPVLVLVGSCRHEEDFRRVETLQDLCSKLGISEFVEFRINLKFEEVVEEMRNASAALHTMKDEHFGIGVVECMSAGLIMIAHDSGGPQMDIVVDYAGEKTGFLASDVHSFSNAMEQVWSMDYEDLMKIRKNARSSVSQFSVLRFEEAFISAMTSIEIIR